MNTKSMVLILNGLLLFNTVSHGFSMSSWRKKAVEMCTRFGKRSIAVVCGMAIALLNTLGIKAGRIIATAKYAVKQKQGATQQIPVQTLPQRHDGGPVIPQPAQEIKNRPRSATFATSAAAAAGRSAAIILHPLEIPESPPISTQEQQKDRRLAEIEEAIKRIKQRREQIERFKKVIDDIRNHNYRLSYLPPQLSGTGGDRNQLEKLPKVLVQKILQFIFSGHLYHERSFYVPLHHSELELLKGQKARLEFWQRSTINFIDGDPERLELATCVPLPEDSETNDRYKHVDSIIIDTTTCNHTIKRIKTDTYGGAEAPTSYQQRAIGDELYSTTNPEVPPLIQQLNFIGNYDFTWLGWCKDNSVINRKRGNRYAMDSYGGTRKFGKPPYTRPFKYGLQRNLKNGKMVWVIPKGEYVGIYEKAQRWFDKDTALQHPAFENESVIPDRTGDEFHLVQVIQEETPVYSVSLPHTPVYIKDTDGNEIRGCLGYPPDDSTAHLRSPIDYPDHLDALALGFNQIQTNNRCSLYKQLQEKLSEYHPDLLIHQQNALTPTQRSTYRQTILYPDEDAIMPYDTGELRVIAAHRVLKGLLRRLPPLE
jgi:hypothetical protein